MRRDQPWVKASQAEGAATLKALRQDLVGISETGRSTAEQHERWEELVLSFNFSVVDLLACCLLKPHVFNHMKTCIGIQRKSIYIKI
jgi:hypothetical protein